jgi:phosphatidylglycerol:prolipoprotein diacylglycerol transferase
MHPILFKAGSFTVYSYGVLLVIAFYVSIYLARIEAKKEKIDSQIILDIALLVLISGIIGGKLAYIVLNLPLYVQTPFDTNLWRAGFIFHGGLFLSIGTVLLYTKKKKLSFLFIADLLIPYVALGQAIGRIGCFLNGCCYGKPTALRWGRTFPLSSPAGYHYGALRLHPTQLYSSLFLFILFLILKNVRVHQKFEGETLLLYFLLYPAFRFFLDFLRGDRLVSVFYHLNIFQLICIGMIGISLVIFLLKVKSRK